MLWRFCDLVRFLGLDTVLSTVYNISTSSLNKPIFSSKWHANLRNPITLFWIWSRFDFTSQLRWYDFIYAATCGKVNEQAGLLRSKPLVGTTWSQWLPGQLPNRLPGHRSMRKTVGPGLWTLNSGVRILGEGRTSADLSLLFFYGLLTSVLDTKLCIRLWWPGN